MLVATGSDPIIPDLPGIQQPHVVTCVDLFRGKNKVGDTAAKVTVVEMLPELMVGSLPVPRMNRTMLLDLLTLNGVHVITDANVQEITSEGVITTGKTYNGRVIKANTVILAVGMKSNNALYEKLLGKVIHLYALGDCREPRNVQGAMWDGYEVGRIV